LKNARFFRNCGADRQRNRTGPWRSPRSESRRRCRCCAKTNGP